MTTELFLVLLAGFAILSSLITEGIKGLVDNQVASNVLAVVVALVVGIVGGAVYYQLNAIAFTVNNVIYLVLLGLFGALTSMVGYDKVKQAIEQFR